jgi:broad specificity phosphatase PhoE
MPSKCKKLIFVRHGESLYNAHGAKRMKGLVDAHLTVRGFRQCHYLAGVLRRTMWLQSLGVSLVCVSPLSRALQTYKETFKWFVDEENAKQATAAVVGEGGGGEKKNNVRVRIDPRLTERLSHSSSQGTPRSVLEKTFAGVADFSQLPEKWWHRSDVMTASSFETDEQVRARTTKFLRWVRKQPETVILCVGHGASMRMMMQQASRRGGGGGGSPNRGVTSEGTEFAASPQHPRMEILGYTTFGNDKLSGTQSDRSTNKSFRCNLDVATCLLY